MAQERSPEYFVSIFYHIIIVYIITIYISVNFSINTKWTVINLLLFPVAKPRRQRLSIDLRQLNVITTRFKAFITSVYLFSFCITLLYYISPFTGKQVRDKFNLMKSVIFNAV